MGLASHQGEGGDRVSDRMALETITEAWQVAYTGTAMNICDLLDSHSSADKRNGADVANLIA